MIKPPDFICSRHITTSDKTVQGFYPASVWEPTLTGRQSPFFFCFLPHCRHWLPWTYRYPSTCDGGCLVKPILRSASERAKLPLQRDRLTSGTTPQTQRRWTLGTFCGVCQAILIKKLVAFRISLAVSTQAPQLPRDWSLPETFAAGLPRDGEESTDYPEVMACSF